MKVLVCGGRDFTDYVAFTHVMSGLQHSYGRFETIIHGGARGADWCAHLFCNGTRKEIEFKADWKSYGRAAGPIRNQRMLDEGKPDLVIAFPGGRGTADMVQRAKAADIEVLDVTPWLENVSK